MFHFSSCFFRQIQRNFGVKSITSHTRGCLVAPCCLLQIFLPQPRQTSLQTSELLNLPRLVLQILHLRVARRMFRPLFPLLFSFGQSSKISLFLLQNLNSSPPTCWLRVQFACSSLCTSNHRITKLLVCLFSHPSSSSHATSCATAALSSTSSCNQHRANHWYTNCCSHPFCPWP